MSLSGLLNIARSSLLAQSGALSVTSKNVANATTPGYTRRVASLDPQAGGGVQYLGETRVFDRFAYAHSVEQRGKKGSADARASALARIEAIVAPPRQTVAEKATSLMTAFVTLTAYPTDPAIQADVLARSTELASSVSNTALQLNKTSNELLERARGTTAEVNERLERVAELNGKIASAEAQGNDAGELRDRRDQSIREIGERLGVRPVEDPQGRITLFGAGAALVEGSKASPLSLDLDAAGAMRFTVQGATTLDVTSRVDSGQLGGLREARDVDLARVRGNLDAYAFDVANTINAVHASGFGKDGVTGRTLFTPPASVAGAAASMVLDPSMVDRPDRIATAGSAAELPGGNSAAVRLAELADAAAFGGATLAGRFATLASDLGMRKASAESEGSLREDTLALAEAMSEGASGVSLDEEMIDMTRYQRAFEASSRVLRTADELLEGLMRDL